MVEAKYLTKSKRKIMVEAKYLTTSKRKIMIEAKYLTKNNSVSGVFVHLPLSVILITFNKFCNDVFQLLKF